MLPREMRTFKAETMFVERLKILLNRLEDETIHRDTHDSVNTVLDLMDALTNMLRSLHDG